LPFDTSVAHQARIYDYLLGGKDNYAADRAAADAWLEVNPLVEPGLVRVEEWRPEPGTDATGNSAIWGAVGRQR
jgi:hypothetical protein